MAYCKTETRGRVLHVTIDRPKVMNALHPPAHRDLADAFDRFAGDPELWVAVITGAGDRAFCAGSDLKHMASAAPGQGDATPESGFAGLTQRFGMNKPIIAMVNGLALGGGLEIALACDLVIAADHATFGFPEPKVGLAAMGGGLHRLARQIPLKQAMGLALTGRTIDAVEARSLGIVNEAVPSSALEATTQRWVEMILSCAPLAVQATKSVMMDSLDHASLIAAIGHEYPAARRMLDSRDAEEGPRAFAEHRSPSWQGR
ncbi:MAG: enoyl-CoA hydratase/isomerase family protein [Alphaproteobacteria bacterium]|nr:enoyl-CoA hydratase/isomerase family protein [Alphaproteobacteria bacterium]